MKDAEIHCNELCACSILQIQGKYPQEEAAGIVAAVVELFSWLPPAHLVNGKVLAVHGGLPQHGGATLEEIAAVERGR